MTNKTPETARLADLEAALDTYGADRTRWPAPVRHALSGLIAANAQAQKMVDDAKLFDDLLDMAPAPTADEISGLANRIVAAAERQPRIVTFQPKAPAVRRPVLRETGWAAAALAASLVLGIMAGQSRFSEPATALLSAAGDQTDAAAGAQLAQTDETEGLLYEDLL